MYSSRWFLAIGWIGAVSAIDWIGAVSAIDAQAITRDSTAPLGAGVRVLSAASAGRERARVTIAGGGRRVGWVVSADDTLLVLKPDRRPIEFWYPKASAYDRRQLARLELSEFPKRRTQSTAVGAIVGAIAGAVIGAVAMEDKCLAGKLTPCHGREVGLFVGGAFGLGVGGFLGRHVIGRDRWIEVPTMGPSRP